MLRDDFNMRFHETLNDSINCWVQFGHKFLVLTIRKYMLQYLKRLEMIPRAKNFILAPVKNIYIRYLLLYLCLCPEYFALETNREEPFEDTLTSDESLR